MSQSVLVQCPHCRAAGNLADPALFGQAISCPVCQQIFTAPFPATGQPPLPETTAVGDAAAVPASETPPAGTDSPAIPEPTPVETAAAPETFAAMSAAESPAALDDMPPAVASGPAAAGSEPTPPALDTAVATTGDVSPTSEPVAISPLEQLTAAEQVPAPCSTSMAAEQQTLPAEILSTTPNFTVTSGTLTTAESPATTPIAQSASGDALPAGAVSVAPTPPAIPVATAMPGAVPVAAPIAASMMAPVAPAGGITVPQGPITFPGQAAAFPTEIALPQEGVFVPPPTMHTFDGPLPAFLAPAAAPGAEETQFAESLPEPVARGSVKPPKVRSKSTQTIIVSTITVILLFATVMFLMGDPSRRFGKKPKSKEPEEDNPIAQPLDPGASDQSIQDVFARIKAASDSNDKKNDSDASKEKK